MPPDVIAQILRQMMSCNRDFAGQLLYMYVREYTHRYMHICICTYINTYIGTYIHTYRHTDTHVYILQGCDRKVVERMNPQVLRAVEGSLRLKIAFAQYVARLADSAQAGGPLSSAVTRADMHTHDKYSTRGAVGVSGRTLSADLGQAHASNAPFSSGQMAQLKADNDALRLQLAELQELVVALETSPQKRHLASASGTQIIFDHMKREAATAKAESLKYEVRVFTCIDIYR